MIDMAGKVVLVTGGSRGIAAAAVRAIVGAGADVVIHYSRNRGAAEGLVTALPDGRCHLVAGDRCEV